MIEPVMTFKLGIKWVNLVSALWISILCDVLYKQKNSCYTARPIAVKGQGFFNFPCFPLWKQIKTSGSKKVHWALHKSTSYWKTMTKEGPTCLRNNGSCWRPLVPYNKVMKERHIAGVCSEPTQGPLCLSDRYTSQMAWPAKHQRWLCELRNHIQWKLAT